MLTMYVSQVLQPTHTRGHLSHQSTLVTHRRREGGGEREGHEREEEKGRGQEGEGGDGKW